MSAPSNSGGRVIPHTFNMNIIQRIVSSEYAVKARIAGARKSILLVSWKGGWGGGEKRAFLAERERGAKRVKREITTIFFLLLVVLLPLLPISVYSLFLFKKVNNTAIYNTKFRRTFAFYFQLYIRCYLVSAPSNP